MPQPLPRPTFSLGRATADDGAWGAYLARAARSPEPNRAAENAAADAMERAVCGPRGPRGRGGIW